MHDLNVDEDRIEKLAQDLTARYGVTMNFKQVAEARQCSVSTARRAFWRGEITGSRITERSPVRFTTRAVAEWILAGEKKSLRSS